MPPKVQKIQFDERGRVILPAGALAPSEETLLARAHLLQGQEARRDSDELLSSSVATPEELKAFVGGRTLTPADILGAKVAQASAAQLREGVAQAAADQVAATNAGAQRVTNQVAAADAAATKGAADQLAEIGELKFKLDDVNASIMRAELSAMDSAIDAASAAVRAERMRELYETKARAEQKIKDAQAAQAAAAAPAPADPTASATPAPADATAPATPKAPALAKPPPSYIQTVRDKLVAHNPNFTPDPRVTSGITAYDKLTASGFWSNKMASAVKLSSITPEEQNLLLQVQEGVEAGGITVKSKLALREYLDDMRAGLVARIPAPPSTPVGAIPLPSVPTTPPGTPVVNLQLTPQTGSGLAASTIAPPAFDWKAAATSAMDLADAGDQLAALRLLAHHAREIPEDKKSAIHKYILGA